MRALETPITENLDAVLPSADGAEVCDMTRKYVRILSRREDGLVAFEFSLGWPELCTELVLPRLAFDEFCTTHHVTFLEGSSHDLSTTLNGLIPKGHIK